MQNGIKTKPVLSVSSSPGRIYENIADSERVMQAVEKISNRCLAKSATFFQAERFTLLSTA